jgi:hypothetical protein
MRITEGQLRRIIREGLIAEGLSGPPETAEEWMYWGGQYGLSAEEDNTGQTMFYVDADDPGKSAITSEVVEDTYGEVETDNDGNTVIYTGAYSQRDKAMSAIEDKFSLRHIQTSEEFDGQPGAIWISGESGDESSDGTELFNYYIDDAEAYEFGVHKEFSDFIKPLGFSAEWYDPGTLMLYRS